MALKKIIIILENIHHYTKESWRIWLDLYMHLDLLIHLICRTTMGYGNLSISEKEFPGAKSLCSSDFFSTLRLQYGSKARRRFWSLMVKFKNVCVSWTSHTVCYLNYYSSIDHYSLSLSLKNFFIRISLIPWDEIYHLCLVTKKIANSSFLEEKQ